MRAPDPAPPAPAAAGDHRPGVGRRAAFALLALLPLAACGRSGRPEPPPDADPSFPRRYPSN